METYQERVIGGLFVFTDTRIQHLDLQEGGREGGREGGGREGGREGEREGIFVRKCVHV